MPEGGQVGPLMYPLLYFGDTTHPEGYSGRVDTYELQINSDPAYGLGNPTSVVADGNGKSFTRITCSAMPPGTPTALSGNRAYVSGTLSTQKCFAGAYGYWEWMIRLAFDGLGLWPALWLLPLLKTKLNGGQTTEIDALEAWYNRMVRQYLGRIYATLHGAHQEASFNATFDGSTTTMTVNSVASGSLIAGGRTSQYIKTVVSQLTSMEPGGALGGRGAYQMDAVAPAYTGDMLLVTPKTQAMVNDHSSYLNQLDNGWHKIGVLIDATFISIYIDGVLAGQAANSGDFYIAPDDAHYALMSFATGSPDAATGYRGPDGTQPGVSNQTVTKLPAAMDLGYCIFWPAA